MRLRTSRVLAVCLFGAALGGCGAGLSWGDSSGDPVPTDAGVSLRDAIAGTTPRAEPAPEAAPQRPRSLADAAAGVAAPASDPRNAPRAGASAAAATDAGRAGDAGPGAGAAAELTPTSVLYAVHLASYRSEDTARRGWDALSFQPALAGLEPRVERVDLGPEKGAFLRLKAGPLADREAAERRCAALVAEGLYCAVETHAGKALN